MKKRNSTRQSKKKKKAIMRMKKNQVKQSKWT